MTLPSGPPRYSTWAELLSSIRKGETGWRPFALQTGLDALNSEDLTEDGVFGPATEAAVKRFQTAFGLDSDGIAGAQTQGELLRLASAETSRLVAGLPAGLMRGFAEGEGANVLAATNWTVAGGVDCGCMQIRVSGPPYSNAGMRAAFAPLQAMVSAAKGVAVRADTFYNGTWVARQGSRRNEYAMRCAIMAHNWPSQGGADYIAAHGICSNPDGLASWAPSSAVFPDGRPVRTRWEWCQFYAMAGPHGEGVIPKYVTSWG